MATKYSSRFRIDDQVFFTMILISILALFVLAFRVTNPELRPDIQITYKGVLVQGTPVSFSAVAKEGKTFKWNFDDGTTSEGITSSNRIHTYKSTGTFIVTVTVNGKWDESKTIFVKRAEVFIDTRLHPQFFVPDSAYVNKSVTFTDSTPDATSWEWRFGESDDIDSREKSPSYVYKNTGAKFVTLKINGRSDRAGRKIIYIKKDPLQKVEEESRQKVEEPRRRNTNSDGPKRPEIKIEDTPTYKPNIITEMPVVRAPEISNAALGEQLKMVALGNKTAADFGSYLCNNDIPVVYNDVIMTFSAMCGKIKKEAKKERRIKSIIVLPVKDDKGCIKSMTIKLKKTLL